MSMELISMDNWNVYFDNEEDLKRAKRDQLFDVLKTLPWVAVVDQYQHWIYTNPDHTDEQRTEAWLQIFENFGASFQLRDSKPFILEGDEYDTAFFDKGPKFMHYFPDALILTHVEFDHADIYRDLEAVKTAFRRLVNLVPRRGRVVAFDGRAKVAEKTTEPRSSSIVRPTRICATQR